MIKNTSGTFSCNTNELSEILEKIKKINDNLGETTRNTDKFSSLQGCEDVTKIPNQINLAQKQVLKTYDRLDKFIKEAEKAETENLNIINKGLNLFDKVWGNFKKLFVNKKETTYLFGGATTAVKAPPSKSKNEIDINVNKKGLEIIAKKYGLDPKSKTLVYDIAKVQGIETEKTTKEKIIKTEMVPRTFDELPQYVKESNGKDAALQNKEALKESDYSFEGKYYWGEAFKSVDDYENGRLVKDLKNGNQIVWNREKNTYIITGISENNIVTIENPNGNGSQTITLEKMASMGGAFYSYELKPEEKITTVIEAKTTKQLKNENDLTKEVLEYEGLPYINKDANLPGLKKFNPLDVFKDATGSHDKYPWLKEEPKEKDKTEVPQTNKKDENVNKWYDPESLPEDTLYDHSGYLYYEQNGLLVKETFCQDSLQYSYDLKLYILAKGYDAGYWIRDDGVQMMGDRVMYATNIKHMDGNNPSNSTYMRGDAWNGTSGPGDIVGLCEASEWCAQGTHEKLFTNPEDGRVADVMFDTYTAWQTPGKHMNRYYNKDEANATRNVMSNPPADTDDRYYQTNEGWKKFFRANPQYLPEGESIEETDWEEYFKQKDPERNS